MAGISDIRHELCLALALWNGTDPILKERMFGLTGPQGNHGEDVKEYWWYLDGLPSHAWLRWRYHYPQAAFPYQDLIDENGRRGFDDPEYELLDTGVFDDERYWIVDVTYAKASPTEVLARITVENQGPESADARRAPDAVVPEHLALVKLGRRARAVASTDAIAVEHDTARRLPPRGCGRRPTGPSPRSLFCDNETNTAAPLRCRADHALSEGRDQRPRGLTAPRPSTRDGRGTKAAWRYHLTVPPGEQGRVAATPAPARRGGGSGRRRLVGPLVRHRRAGA